MRRTFLIVTIGALVAAGVCSSALGSTSTVPGPGTPVLVSPASIPGAPQGSKYCLEVGWDHGNELKSQFGTWPYQQIVIEYRRWCFDVAGGPITYRYSEIHIGTTLCSNHDRYKRLYAGGAGWSYADVMTGAFFDCPTSVPWITLHPEDYQIWRCTTSLIQGCWRTAKVQIGP